MITVDDLAALSPPPRALTPGATRPENAEGRPEGAPRRNRSTALFVPLRAGGWASQGPAGEALSGLTPQPIRRLSA